MGHEQKDMIERSNARSSELGISCIFLTPPRLFRLTPPAGPEAARNCVQSCTSCPSPGSARSDGTSAVSVQRIPLGDGAAGGYAVNAFGFLRLRRKVNMIPAEVQLMTSSRANPEPLIFPRDALDRSSTHLSEDLTRQTKFCVQNERLPEQILVRAKPRTTANKVVERVGARKVPGDSHNYER
jgi:hypothetical protein